MNKTNIIQPFFKLRPILLDRKTHYWECYLCDLMEWLPTPFSLSTPIETVISAICKENPDFVYAENKDTRFCTIEEVANA